MSDTSPIILGDENRLISELASTTLQDFFTNEATQSLSGVGAIASTVAFGVPEGVVHIESQGGIASTVAFGTSAINQQLTAESIASTVSVSTPEAVNTVEDPNYTVNTVIGNPAVFDLTPTIQSYADELISSQQNNQIDNLPNTQIIFEDIEDGGIASTIQFGGFETSITINLDAIASATTLSTDSVLNQTLTVDNGIPSTLAFGVGEGVLTLEEPLISSTLDVGNPGIFNVDTTIFPYRDDPIGDQENTQIDALPPTQLIFEDIEDGGFQDGQEFGIATIIPVISPESIVSTVAFGGEKELINTIEDVTIASALQFGDLVSGGQVDPTSIDPTVAFGVPEGVIHIESQDGIASTVAFGTAEIQQTVSDIGDIASTVAFGIPEYKLTIEEPLIASTVQFGTPVVTKLISNIGGIASTVVISTETGFQGGIFGALIYKDGEISRIGSTESMIVAGGVRVNPSNRVTLTASNSANSQITLPTNPEGFMSVNIDGVDYKVPFFKV